MNRASKSLAGVILCGGHSRRMGSPKHELMFGSQTMLEIVLDRLAEVADPIFVVAAMGQDIELGSRAVLVRDRRPDRGPLEGIAVGLEASSGQSEHAYVTACDTPLLVSGFIAKLHELAGGCDIVAVDDGRMRHPLGALYRVQLAEAVRAHIDTGHHSARSLLGNFHTRWVASEELADVDPKLHSLRNVNCAQDYVEAAKIAGVKVPAAVLSRL